MALVNDGEKNKQTLDNEGEKFFKAGNRYWNIVGEIISSNQIQVDIISQEF